MDTQDDMGRIFEDIPLDQVSVSFTINSTAAIILAMTGSGVRETGSGARVAAGDDLERYPEGVSGPRNMDLSAQTFPASDRRYH